ncbi:MAG: glycosyltransferase family 4 protein [Acidobacteriota bacterium]
MAHILVLTLVFPPDNVSTAVILGELSADLKAAGHDVTAVTTVPHYNRDSDAETRQPLVRMWGSLLSRSEFQGIRVLHVGMPRKSGRVFSRLLAWSQFHLLSLIAAVALVRRVDVILAPSPPLTIGLCAWLLACVYRAPYIYNVQELYPDIAIALGVLKSRWAVTLLVALERFVYARAQVVTVIAPAMRRRILEKGLPEHKVRLIPNFVDVHDMVPLPRANGFGHEHGIDEAFVVSYAGNMGPAQGLETVLEAASLLSHEPGIVFLLVGDGSSRSGLMAMAQDRGLSNVLFLSYQAYGSVPQIYAASDVCLVSLATNTGCDAIPSKVYRIMACGRPVLACVDANSDLAELVRSTGCGTVVQPGSPEALARAVSDAKRNPSSRAAMGQSGRAHVVTHYGRGLISAQYDSLVREVARASRGPVQMHG